jgi:hypothetical protein
MVQQKSDLDFDGIPGVGLEFGPPLKVPINHLDWACALSVGP